MSMPVSRDVNRIEAFSDAVFGFALTLLVVSLEVPRTYADMMQNVRGLPAFAACFAILLMIWQEHHKFFRRYGVHDGGIIWINGVLLFVVLFYVYPLKFLMTLLLGPSGALLGGHVDAETGMRMPALMTMYGAGFVAVFLLLAALHWRARQCLRADPEPSTDMRMLDVDLGACLVYVAIGVVSLGIASLPWRWAPGVAGIAYALLGPAHFLYHHFIVPRAIGRPGLPSQSPQV
jgi:uncharacterized membrane protein